MAGKKMFIGEQFKAGLARISYAPGLYTPSDKGRFMVTLIFPKTGLAPLQNAVAATVKGEWGDKGVERFKNGMIKNPILPGDGKSARDNDTGELKPGMGSDVAFIRPWSNNAIPCFDPKVLPMDAKTIYSGWWGYPVLQAFAWNNAENGDGVGFWISMWQHIKEDEVIGGGGGRANPDAFFEKIATEDDAGAAPVSDASGMFG